MHNTKERQNQSINQMKHKKKEKKRIEDYWVMEVVGSAKAPVKPSVRERVFL